MRMTRFSAAVAGAALVTAFAQRAQAQQTFPQTIYWGSGLIDIPAAWVGPVPGDFAINYSAKRFDADPNSEKINYNNRLNSQLSFSMSGWGVVEAGWAAYSSNPEWGFFGHLLLLNQEHMRARGGAVGWMPSLAVGARNIGPYKHIDRFGVGYNLLPPGADPNQAHVADSLHQSFNTSTVYGVATESFSLTDIRPTWADVDLSFTAGYGNGLFSDHGDLPVELYAKHATGGLFYGGKVDFNATPNLGVTLMAENNAWDYNVGGVLNYRGIRGGLYLTELGAGSAASDTSSNPTNAQRASRIYNYSKVVFSLGWQSNIFALLHGNFLQNRAAELERARQALLAEIQARQQRIAALELEINRYEAQNLLELEQRRAQAEAELSAEREALKRLEDRLRRVESQTGTPTTPTTPTNPPQR
jgi:hypothetical protein